jgi:hypothetical protein
MKLKKIYLTLALSLLIMPMFGYVASAQGGYYVSQEEAQLEEARQDAQEEQGFREQLELESKVSAFEEQEEKERAEAAEANKRLLIYVALGVGGIILISVLSHLWQKHNRHL